MKRTYHNGASIESELRGTTAKDREDLMGRLLLLLFYLLLVLLDVCFLFEYQPFLIKSTCLKSQLRLSHWQ